MTNTSIKKLLIAIFILFILWVAIFASVTEKTNIIASFGYLVGQIIVVSCAAALVIWFYNRRKR